MKKLLLIYFTLLFTQAFSASVTIQVGNGGSTFSPSTTTVTQGDDVIFDFSNASVSHNVTSEDAAWNTLTTTGTINTSSFTPGVYKYYCSFHSSGNPRTGMVGSFTVEAASTPDETITVSNFSFTPSTVTVTKGDDIFFDFTEGTHTVTSADDAWNELTSSGTISTANLDAGTYNYYCAFHSSVSGSTRTGMIGSFTVVDPIPGAISGSESKGLFSAFPNPVENRLTLSFPATTSERADVVKIISVEGTEVASYNVASFGSEITLDLSSLKEGFYFCRIYSNGVVLDTKKIIKKK